MAHFITEKCIGCTLCGRSCPVQAIEGAPKQRHVILAKRCIDCGVCGRVCAAGAVLDAAGVPAERVPRKAWPSPAVDAAKCSACGVCVESCGRDALAISRPAYRGDLAVHAYLAEPARCVGCGLCRSCCPLGAIAMRKGADA